MEKIKQIIAEKSGNYYLVGRNCTEIVNNCTETTDGTVDRQYDIYDGEKKIASFINCSVEILYQ